MANPFALALRGIRQVGLRPSLEAVAHAVRTRWVKAKFTDPQRPLRGLPLVAAFLRRLPIPLAASAPAGPVTLVPGQLVTYARDGQTLTLVFTHATVAVSVLAPDLIHLAYRRSGPTAGPARAWHHVAEYVYARPDADWPAHPFDVVETPEAVEVRTGRLVCSVARADGRLTLVDRDGNYVAAEAAPVGWTADGRVVSSWRMPPDCRLYGLGQRTARLDRRGGSYVNWNTDPRTYGPGDDPVNLCVPFLLALHSGGQQGYGFLLENAVRSQFDLGQSDPEVACIRVEDQALDYDFYYGPALSDVLRRYTERTGRVPLLPLWALGYHQSRWSYFPEERVRRLVRDFRHVHRVPCDAVHFDIHYMDGYRCFTWDRRRFPDPARMIADLHGEGFRAVTIIDPGIKADRAYGVFREGKAEGAFCRYPDGRPFIGPVWPGNCAFPDFTDARVREWWGRQYRGLLEAGVDGIWNDMNEPAVFGEAGATIPAPVCHELEGEGGDHRRAHNLYGLLMARATAEGLERLRPDRRPFVLTRSGWAGVQRYSAHWTGDNCSTWESLRLTLPMVLGLGLSGVAFTGADVGGFAGFPSGELFTRWLQLGAFLPFFRAHTVFESPDQEPWSWGEPYLSANRAIIQLRYRLLPYLYTALWRCSHTGLPIARPPLVDFQDDAATHGLEDEFMCGDALLVAPVLDEGVTRRSVYLPAHVWYDFWAGTRYEGPARVEVDAPLERIPLFVRAGSVVPMGPAVEYAGQRRAEPLAFHVYPGEGQSWLYEDDGESPAFREGESRLTSFTLSRSPTGMDLSRKVEGPFDPGYGQFNVVVHDVAGPPERVVGWPGAKVAHDPRARTLRISGDPFEALSVRW